MTTISSRDQEIEISLNITNLPSESYFRAALQKGSGDPYFGYMQNNNGDWVVISSLSGDCVGYYKVSDTSTTSLVLKFKIGNDAVIDSGNYTLKAHRFTTGCSYTKATNDYAVIINLSTPTASPTDPPPTTAPPTNVPTLASTSTPAKTPTPIPTSTKTPTSAPKSPTATPKTTIAPSPTSKPTAIPIPKKSSVVVAQDIGPTSVLGIAQEEKPSPTPSQEKNNTTNYLPFILIGIGIVFIAGFGILIYHPFGLLKQEE